MYETGLKFQPYPGESLPSVLVRAAHLTAAWENELAAMVGGHHATASALSSESIIAGLAADGPVDRELLAGCQFSDAGGGSLCRIGQLVLSADHVLGSTRRVAPGLLAADIAAGIVPYHRLHWSIGLVDTDITTTEKLIDRCPRCSSPLTWRHVAEPGLCDLCGKKLWLVTPEYPVGEKAEYASLMGNLLHVDNAVRLAARGDLPEGLRTANEAEIFDFVDAIATFEPYVARVRPLPYPVCWDLRLKALRLVRAGHSALVLLIQEYFKNLEGRDLRLGTAIATAICKAAADRCLWPMSRGYFLSILRDAMSRL